MQFLSKKGDWKKFFLITITTLQWCHNEHDGISDHQPRNCLLNRLFRRRSKKASKLSVTGLCAGNSPVTGEFPTQMASNVEDVSISWHHHAIKPVHWAPLLCYSPIAKPIYTPGEWVTKPFTTVAIFFWLLLKWVPFEYYIHICLVLLQLKLQWHYPCQIRMWFKVYNKYIF